MTYGESVTKIENRRQEMTKFPFLETTSEPSQQGFQQKLQRTQINET